MKIKPKEVLINIPIVLMFKESHQIPTFASNINSILHGKIKLKYEELGCLGSEYLGLFYIQRNDEFHDLRKKFKDAIEEEEINFYNANN